MATIEAIQNDVSALRGSLSALEKIWDGRQSILQMRAANNTQWRQMEWIGFYGEFITRKCLANSQVIKPNGDKFGNVVFDLKGSINWDIKTHPNSSPGAILNDCEATLWSIEKYEYHGLLILCVDCEFDESGEFKRWHDELKGGTSAYEADRVSRGAKSRRRKTQAKLTDIRLILLNAENIGQLSKAQEGWRNSNGAPRRSKYSISHKQITGLALT